MSCEAHLRAAPLTDAALFVLMAIQHLGKSPKARVFHETDLSQRPSVMFALDRDKKRLRVALKELLNEGLLLPAGRRKFACSAAGDVVKHRFNDLRDVLSTEELLLASNTRSLDFVTVLRRHMAELCEHEDRKRDAKSP